MPLYPYVIAASSRRIPRVRCNWRATVLLLIACLPASLCACGGPEQPKMVPVKHDDGVPANSVSEARLNGSQPKAEPPLREADTLPYTLPTGNGEGGGADAGKTATGKISATECKQLFDRFIDLSIGHDARLDNFPPEMLAELKERALAEARSQKGDPCATQRVTRAQYTCAIKAPTAAAWQKCLK